MPANSPHVCIVSIIHPPDDGRVTHKIGRGLREAGFRVSWVGPGTQPPKDHHGIEFHLVPPGPGILKRILRRRVVHQAAQQLKGVDVWIGVEMDSARLAINLARANRARSVFDVHEVYHDDIVRHKFPGLLAPPARWLVYRAMRRLCRDADLVMGAGITRVEPYRDVAPNAIVVRHCLSGSYGEMKPASPGGKECFRLMHGKATLLHGTREVLGAMRWAKENGLQTLRVVFFRFPRHAADEARIIAEATKLGVAEMIEWRDPVPFEGMFDILSECDLGLICYPRILGCNSMPNRVFEYLAVGLPFVFPSYATELRGMLEGNGCAIGADTEDAAALGGVLVALARDADRLRAMGGKGRQLFRERFNMEQEIAPLTAWIAGGSQPSRAI